MEANHHNDLSVLLSSGFRVASTNRAQHPLDQALITKISFAGSGSLLVESATMDNVKSWEARWKPEASPDTAYQHANNLGATRKMTITGLPRSLA